MHDLIQPDRHALRHLTPSCLAPKKVCHVVPPLDLVLVGTVLDWSSGSIVRRFYRAYGAGPSVFSAECADAGCPSEVARAVEEYMRVIREVIAMVGGIDSEDVRSAPTDIRSAPTRTQ